VAQQDAASVSLVRSQLASFRREMEKEGQLQVRSWVGARWGRAGQASVGWEGGSRWRKRASCRWSWPVSTVQTDPSVDPRPASSCAHCSPLAPLLLTPSPSSPAA